MTLLTRLRHELRDRTVAADGLIEPTDDEAQNGWTAETLTAYVTGRWAAQSVAADPESLYRRLADRPRRCRSTYRRLR